jgi:hypothetical protein
MKLKTAIVSSFFLILALCLLPVRSQAEANSTEMQECIKSPKHLIKEGNAYFACGSSKLDDIPSANTDAENHARAVLLQALQKKKITLNHVNIFDHWKNPVSAHSARWAVLEYTPASQVEAKKLDEFIASKASGPTSPNKKEQPVPSSGINSQQLAQNVSGATSGVSQAFKSSTNEATPNPSSPQAMGNLASQTQGQTPQNSGTGSSGATKASPNENPQNSDQRPLLQKTRTPPATPPAPDKPKKSKPGFFAKIWNGIKKVGHYIATSRIGTGLLLGAAAALMVTGFGAAPGVIIAAAVLGGGIGLAAGPLANSSPSKALPPPPPIASSTTNSNNPSPAPTTTAPNPPAVPTPPGGTISLNSGNVMTEANATAKSLNQNKPTEDETGSGLPPSAAVTPRNTNQNSLASNKPVPTHKNIPKASSPYHKKPSAPSKKSVEAPKAGISVTKSAAYGAIVGGSAGLGLAAAGIISSPLWASAAIGVAAGAAVAAAGVAAWNYFKNKPAPAKPKVKPQKNQNAGDAPKTQALPRPPIPGPQEM